jgi:glycogen synthase
MLPSSEGHLRILFVSGEHAASKGTGGVGSYVATISKALARLGHEVHVLSCVVGVDSADSEDDGVRLHTRPVVQVRGLGRLVRGPLSRQALLLALSNFLHARRLGRFDVVEGADWRAEGLLFALLRTTPLVTHLHTPTHVLQAYNQEVQDRDARFVSWLERTSARRSRRVTCPAGLLVAELRAQGWLTRHVDVIRYPVEWTRFTKAAMRAPDTRSILFVGRLERRKAPERILRAVAELDRRGIAANAVFVGRGSGIRDGMNYGAWVEKLARELDVRCSFVGESRWDDIPEIYADAAVVCVPSEFESFSMAAVEGMAAGRPIVVTRTVGAAELLSDDPHGQVCGGDAEEVADALAPFLAEPDTAAAVGAANRELVISACDPTAIAEQRERLYREIVR